MLGLSTQARDSILLTSYLCDKPFPGEMQHTCLLTPDRNLMTRVWTLPKSSLANHEFYWGYLKEQQKGPKDSYITKAYSSTGENSQKTGNLGHTVQPAATQQVGEVLSK